jgi:hypothetical protein
MRRIIGCVLSVAMFGGILGASATTARADTWTGAPPPAGYTMVLGTSPDTGATRWIAVDSDLLPAEGLTEVVSSVVPSDPVGLSTNSGCWDYTKVAIGKNNIGTELWRLTMKRHWCGNYGVPLYPAVTSHPAATAQPNIKGIGGAWSWKGFVDGNTSLTGFCYSVSGFSGCPAHADQRALQRCRCFRREQRRHREMNEAEAVTQEVGFWHTWKGTLVIVLIVMVVLFGLVLLVSLPGGLQSNGHFGK